VTKDHRWFGRSPDADPNNKILGHYSPDWLAGITNTFTYKNIALSS
jgi:hypothetical protein